MSKRAKGKGKPTVGRQTQGLDMEMQPTTPRVSNLQILGASEVFNTAIPPNVNIHPP